MLWIPTAFDASRSQEHVVKLNVGGQVFTTSLNTLQREDRCGTIRT